MYIQAANSAGYANSLQGLANASAQVTNASERIATRATEGGSASVQAQVDLLAGEKLYAANARVLETQSSMIGSVLNIKA
ncbi:hypothetical protein [Aliidiomarina celeris]|uniref:hypothetical protein n=1 Tax=Aliidiomarina celeris TaxID=2249428 RepID=UPI000DE84E21|nr:hypothetical protein [Aliidiomarina celeris]